MQDNYVYTASDGVDMLLDHIKYDFSSVRESVEIIEEQQDIDIQRNRRLTTMGYKERWRSNSTRRQKIRNGRKNK